MNDQGALDHRTRSCRRWLQGCLSFALACSAACDARDNSNGTFSELVGRYEPSELPDGGKFFATQPCTRAEIADKDSGAPSAGSLDISFTPAVAPGVVGHWDTEATGHLSAAAIWIQDENGALVKTLDLWGQSPFCLQCLPDYYMPFAGGCMIDTVTRATLHSYEPWQRTWDGKSLHGAIVPDGNYTLVIDVQIDEEHPMAMVRVPFTKGRDPFVMTLPSMPPQTGLTLTYTPE